MLGFYPTKTLNYTISRRFCKGKPDFDAKKLFSAKNVHPTPKVRRSIDTRYYIRHLRNTLVFRRLSPSGRSAGSNFLKVRYFATGERSEFTGAEASRSQLADPCSLERLDGQADFRQHSADLSVKSLPDSDFN